MKWNVDNSICYSILSIVGILSARAREYRCGVGDCIEDVSSFNFYYEYRVSKKDEEKDVVYVAKLHQLHLYSSYVHDCEQRPSERMVR